MKELIKDFKENEVEITVEKQQQKEIKLIGRQRKIRGLILWEFNQKTKELKQASYKKQDFNVTSLTPSPSAMSVSNKVQVKYMHTRIGAENLIYDKLNWHVVKHYPAFVRYIEKNGIPDVISFDHDLADGHYHENMQNGILNYDGEAFGDDMNKTGYHCAKWLIDYCMDNGKNLPRCIVHSMNPVGTENIQSLINSFQKSSLTSL